MQISNSPRVENKTRAIVHMDHIAHNYRTVKELCGKKVMAVLKADGYGHGAVEIACRLQEEGSDTFAVAILDEALSLRRAGITGLILILGYTLPEALKDAIEADISLTVGTEAYFDLVEAEAKRLQKPVKIHLKLDSGMNRTGFDAKSGALTEELKRVSNKIKRSKYILAEGIYTHFASADEPDSDFTEQQFACFAQTVKALEADGCIFALHHTCNSAGALRYPEMRLDMVRLGIHLYGCSCEGTDLLPAMELKTTVIFVKTVPENEGVGYGLTYHTKEPKRIATIAAGYADGVPRLLSNKGRVLLHGKYAPIVGRVCMDMMMVDVTEIPETKVGDIATIFGFDGENNITADEMAAHCGLISYEIICGISKRVVREYQ